MKISLVVQCIDTFGFVPAEDRLCFHADGKRFSPVRKSGGFYIAARELPEEFTLSVSSDVYYGCEFPVSLKDETVRVNLIRRLPPPRKAAAWFKSGSCVRAALEYGYFCLAAPLNAGDGHIAVENPYRFCLEGRTFLLLDTCSGAEEFIVPQRARNALMTEFTCAELINNYSAEHSVMLPAFDLYVDAAIPVERPIIGTASVRLYGEDGKCAVRTEVREVL